jgi:hypothetical protein
MSPSQINDSARKMMAQLAQYRDDSSGLLTTAGGPVAYTVSTNQGLPSPPRNGQQLTVTFNVTNGANATLVTDGGSAFAIQQAPGSAVLPGALVAGTPYRMTFLGGAWVLAEVFNFNTLIPVLVPIGGTIIWWSNTLPNSDATHWAWCNGATIINGQSLNAALYNACPILQSGANIVLPNLCEVVPMGRRNMNGAASRGLVYGPTPGSGNASVLGQQIVIGENSHFLQGYEVGQHTHGAENPACTVNEGGGHRHPASIYDPGHVHQILNVNAGTGSGPVGGGGVPYNAAGLVTLTTGGQIYSGGVGGPSLRNWDGVTFDVTFYATTGMSVVSNVSIDNNASPAQNVNITQPTMPTNWIIRIA